MKADDHSKQSVGQAPAPCGRHKLKRPAQVTQGQLTQKHKTYDAGRSLVGVQHNLLQGLGVCQRLITPALALRKLEVVLLLVVPSLVRGPQADERRVDISRTMTHEKPVTL